MLYASWHKESHSYAKSYPQKLCKTVVNQPLSQFIFPKYATGQHGVFLPKMSSIGALCGLYTSVPNLLPELSTETVVNFLILNCTQSCPYLFTGTNECENTEF